MHPLRVIHRLNEEATRGANAYTPETSKALADAVAARKAEVAARQQADTQAK